MASTKGKVNGRSVDELRKDIYGTRQRISNDLNVLERRFGPGGMIDRAATYLKDEARRSEIYQTVRNHPVSAAISAAGLTSAAAGIVWMAATGSESAEGVEPTSKVGRKMRHFREKARELKDRVAGKAQEVKDRVADKAQEMKERVGEKTDEFKARYQGEQEGPSMGERLDQAGQSVKETAKEYRQKAGEAAMQAGQKLKDVRRQLRDSVRENPLPIAVAAMAVGVLVGELLPKSAMEDELVDKGKEKLGEVGEREIPREPGEAVPQGAGQPEGERNMPEGQNQPEPQELSPQIAC